MDEAHLETKLRPGPASLGARKDSDRERPPERREVETGGYYQILDEESEQLKSTSSEKAASRSLGFLELRAQEPPPPKPMQEEL